MGWRPQKGDGESADVFLLFYQRIFHNHIRDKSPTCTMFSPPTFPSIFPANCQDKTKWAPLRCPLSGVFFSIFIIIQTGELFSPPYTKCNAVGPSFISLHGENLSRGQQRVALE